jgi:hypothetical protein
VYKFIVLNYFLNQFYFQDFITTSTIIYIFSLAKKASTTSTIQLLSNDTCEALEDNAISFFQWDAAAKNFTPSIWSKVADALTGAAEGTERQLHVIIYDENSAICGIFLSHFNRVIHMFAFAGYVIS